MKVIKTILVLTLSSTIAWGQGVLFDNSYMEQAEEYEVDQLGFTGDLPSSASLRKYAPIPLNQTGSSCVGWSLGYGAMTIYHNIGKNRTHVSHKQIGTFDPYNIYSLLREKQDFNCEKGITVLSALKLLNEDGLKKTFHPPILSCNSEFTEEQMKAMKDFAKNYKIKDAFFLDPSREGIQEDLKSVLASNIPIVIGAKLDESVGGVSSDGQWKVPSPFSGNMGHAMCLVGYDDNKFGGAFEILNSWGSSFGDGGYNWITYEDFARVVIEIWVFDLYTDQFRSTSCSMGDCTDGYGMFTYENGDSFEGFFNEGYPDTYGIYYSNTGSAYVGYWKAGKQDGPGIFFSKEMKLYQCVFDNGEQVSAEEMGFVNDERAESLLHIISEMNMNPDEVEDAYDEDIDASFAR